MCAQLGHDSPFVLYGLNKEQWTTDLWTMCLLLLTEDHVDEHPASVILIALNTVLMLCTQDFTRLTEPLYTVSENALFTLYTGRDEMWCYCEFWLVHK